MWGTAYGVPMTLSFWLKTNIATNSVVTVTVRNGAYNYSYNINVSVAASGSWQFVSQTVPAPPSGSTWAIDNTTMLDLGIAGYQAAGLTANVNTWENLNRLGTTSSTNIWATLNNYIEFTGVQLEKGSIATPFEFRPYSVELQLCQRYYSRLNALQPYSHFPVMGYISSTSAAVMTLMLPAYLRTQPTQASQLTMGGTFTIMTGTSFTGYVIALDTTSSTLNTVRLTATGGTGGTVGQSLLLRAENSSSAFLAIDVEI